MTIGFECLSPLILSSATPAIVESNQHQQLDKLKKNHSSQRGPQN